MDRHFCVCDGKLHAKFVVISRINALLAMESHHSILFCIVNMNIHAKYFKLFMHKRSVMHIDLLQLVSAEDVSRRAEIHGKICNVKVFTAIHAAHV